MWGQYGIDTTMYSVALVANANSYQWSVPTGFSIISGQGTNSIKIAKANNFTSGNVSVVSVNGCATSAVRILAVNTIPTVPGAITGTTSNLCGTTNMAYSIVAVNGATSYNWAIPSNATIVSGQGTNSISVNFDNVITAGTIKVAAINSCGSSTLRSITLTNCSGTSARMMKPGENDHEENAIKSETPFKIFPNPTGDGKFNLEYYSAMNQNLLFEVFDLTGKNMLREQITVSEGINVLPGNVEILDAGLYIVKLTDVNCVSQSIRLVKNK